AGSRAECDAEVSPHTLQPRALERCIPEAAVKFLLGQVLKKGRTHRGRLSPGLELGNAGGPGKALVPGTHVIADVAAEGVALEPIGQVVGDGTPLLDGEIGDAPGSVEQ